MNDEASRVRMSMRLKSQTSWRTPERARLLIELFLDTERFGAMTSYRVNDGRERASKSFQPQRLQEQIESGRLEFLEAEWTEPVPGYLDLSVDDAEWDDRVGHLVGGSRLAAGRALGELHERHALHDMRPWLEVIERLAGPLDLRFAGIREVWFTQPKTDQNVRRKISPQYCHYPERVMLFGGADLERFGADYLRAAPVHQVRELDNGAILLITSPDSLDAFTPEDEALYDQVHEYFMAHPRAGTLI